MSTQSTTADTNDTDTIDTSSLIYALSLARSESAQVEARLASLKDEESALRAPYRAGLSASLDVITGDK